MSSAMMLSLRAQGVGVGLGCARGDVTSLGLVGTHDHLYTDTHSPTHRLEWVLARVLCMGHHTPGAGGDTLPPLHSPLVPATTHTSAHTEGNSLAKSGLIAPKTCHPWPYAWRCCTNLMSISHHPCCSDKAQRVQGPPQGHTACTWSTVSMPSIC